MLRNIAVASLLLSVMVVAGGCKDTVESIMEDELKCKEDMLEILKGIKDEKSAKDAISAIEGVKEDMKAVGERKKAWREAMEEEYEDREETASKGISKERSRLRGEKWAEKVLEVLYRKD